MILGLVCEYKQNYVYKHEGTWWRDSSCAYGGKWPRLPIPQYELPKIPDANLGSNKYLGIYLGIIQNVDEDNSVTLYHLQHS